MDLAANITEETPSESTLKPERVAQLIRERILEDELSPGTAIRERTLATELGVSRTPLREALKILATEGLVELAPRRAATVAAPSVREQRELLQLLGALEGFAGALACTLATPEDIRQLRALHYEMLAAYMRGDRLAYFHRNQDIHTSLVAITKNRVLIEHHRRLNAQVYRLRYVTNLKTERWESAIKEHELILDLLERREADAIRPVLEDHVLKAFDQMQRQAEAREAEAGKGEARKGEASKAGAKG
ncbi:GntR family transcriptional regulator [Acuticoccus sp. M5D2P5]|uniref:GntR family transcriptional regulator n=1 Tax=Acuticoccus kalidii TaxID=2910977 RepID=UPI001F2B481F|nr:GntR family transcriptional regulator [Acuticoccus kalidii]